jgi:hypothetical protein
LLKEKQRTITTDKKSNSFLLVFRLLEVSPPMYRKVVIGLLAFTLFNSSDVFLLLKAKESGLSDTLLVFIFFTISFMPYLLFPIEYWLIKLV